MAAHLRTKSNAKRGPVRPALRRACLAVCALALAALACNFPGGTLVEIPPTPTPQDFAWIFTPPARQATLEPGGPTPPPEIITPPPVDVASPPVLYYAQSGDSLETLAARFGVSPGEITSPEPLQPGVLINPGQLLVIPDRLGETTSARLALPDSEVIYAAPAGDFDLQGFITQGGGRLSRYQEWLGSTGWTSGAAIVQRVAQENSINPRLLLALLQYQSGWVYGEPGNLAQDEYPLGLVDYDRRGLYRQLVWAVNQLSIGYYGWREGRLTSLQYPDGGGARLAPDLNAGTAALQYFFSRLYDKDGWTQALSLESGLPALYEQMFGNPWLRAQLIEPLFPAGLEQPVLILPFVREQVWAFTGGPHGAWEHDGAWAALDFAPASVQPGCFESFSWLTAAASGLVVRSERGVVVIDLDGDGDEHTGWVLLYLHVAEKLRVPAGTLVQQGERIGFPSCEGGVATGTHVHIARKYNGEWIPADGPLPFVLGGWRAHAGPAPYKGYLTRDDQTVQASDLGIYATRILRTPADP